MRTLFIRGTTINDWIDVQVWQRQRENFVNITGQWNWSVTQHQHYEVVRYLNGSYWVPASTHPPRSWNGNAMIIGTEPAGNMPVNPNGNEMRPDTTYIWIPENSIPNTLTPGETTNSVECGYPLGEPNRLNV